MGRGSRTFLTLAAVAILGSCALRSEDSDSNLLVDVKYGAQTFVSQVYEIRVNNDRVAVFTGTRNVKASGTHSYPISPEQYEATLRLLKSSALGKSEPPDPYFGSIARVTTRLDGVTTTTTVGFTNLKVFFVFRKALEDILGIRAYRCPYELGAGGLELCAVNDEFEKKALDAD